jgi:uncharacterized protein YutE (UPF0331/DUF86 family)/predicted nucleotidyltransferase
LTAPSKASDAREVVARCLAHESPRVIAAYLFGSAARQETTLLSDIDIAVLVDEPDSAASVRAYPRLRRCLEKALSEGGTVPLDLVFLNDAPPVLAGRAISGALLYSVDERRRVACETGILCQYQDVVPFHEYHDRWLHARILAGIFGHRSAAMIDRRVVNDRLAYIQSTLQQLRGRQALSLDTLRSDADKRGATLYELQTCLEAMTDIANHIIDAMGLRKPKTRAEAFEILAQAGVLPGPLAERLAQTVSLRDILVHGYLDVLVDLVHQTVQHDLGDVEAFARHIVVYLQDLPQ